MLNANQISSHKFYQPKQGLYKADEVDEFMKLVVKTVSELYDTNKQIQKKISGLTGDLEAYYKDKDSIATTLIAAQSFSNEIVSDANKKAEDIISKAEKQASDILEEKQNQADNLISKAENTAEKVLAKAQQKADEYIASINARASEIITNANEQASKIVSRAFGDAQKARETCDEIIDNANKVFPSVSQDVSLLKIQLEEAFKTIMTAVDSIDVPDEISIERTALNEEDVEIEALSLPEPFSMSDAEEDEADFVEPMQEVVEEQIEEVEESIEEIEKPIEEAESVIEEVSEEISIKSEKLLDLFDEDKQTDTDNSVNHYQYEDLFSDFANQFNGEE